VQSSHRVPDGQILVSDLGYLSVYYLNTIRIRSDKNNAHTCIRNSGYFTIRIQYLTPISVPFSTLTDADSLILASVLIKRKTNNQNVSIPTIIV
jgi:hypothetical protein